MPVLRPAQLAHPEHDRQLDVLAGPEKCVGTANLGVEVMVTDVGPELDLLDLDSVLSPLGLLFTLENEPAVVHDLADRRPCVRSDLDQVLASFGGRPSRIVDLENTDLLAVAVDYTNRCVADIFIDAVLRLRRGLTE